MAAAASVTARFAGVCSVSGRGDAPAGAGSGIVWDSSGHVVTNWHVVAGAAKVNVTFTDQQVFSATVVGFDDDKDIAVLQVDYEHPVAVAMGKYGTPANAPPPAITAKRTGAELSAAAGACASAGVGADSFFGPDDCFLRCLEDAVTSSSSSATSFKFSKTLPRMRIMGMTSQ